MMPGAVLFCTNRLMPSEDLVGSLAMAGMENQADLARTRTSSGVLGSDQELARVASSGGRKIFAILGGLLQSGVHDATSRARRVREPATGQPIGDSASGFEV